MLNRELILYARFLNVDHRWHLVPTVFDRCWIVKKRLDLAIERLKDEFTFNVTWKPFLLQLIHNVRERGIPLKDYLWQKYGKGYAEDIFSANSSVNRNAAEVVSEPYVPSTRS